MVVPHAHVLVPANAESAADCRALTKDDFQWLVGKSKWDNPDLSAYSHFGFGVQMWVRDQEVPGQGLARTRCWRPSSTNDGFDGSVRKEPRNALAELLITQAARTDPAGVQVPADDALQGCSPRQLRRLAARVRCADPCGDGAPLLEALRQRRDELTAVRGPAVLRFELRPACPDPLEALRRLLALARSDGYAEQRAQDLWDMEGASGGAVGLRRMGGEPPCGCCGADAPLRCSGCRRVWYCASGCQRKHWKMHKPDCIEWQRRPEGWRAERLRRAAAAAAAAGAAACVACCAGLIPRPLSRPWAPHTCAPPPGARVEDGRTIVPVSSP